MQKIKLLIVDDEETIRKGLAGIVDWDSLGYQVVSTLEDGRSAIEYLETMPVDVVLTDIKMTFVSGIELAKYINENKPHIKTVLISGYREFELARQAINCNAFCFLLKPTDIDELRKVFTDLRQELEKERQREEQEKFIKAKNDELQEYFLIQFFTDLLMGAIRSESEINDRAKLLNSKYDLMHNKCGIIHGVIHDYDNFLNQKWKYGKEELANAIKNIIHVETPNIKYMLLRNMKDSIRIVALETCREENVPFFKAITEYCAHIKKCTKELIGVDMELTVTATYGNAAEIVHYKSAESSMVDNMPVHENTIGNNEQEIVTEQNRLFISYVCAGNYPAAVNLLFSIMDQMTGKDINNIRSIRDWIINLFAMLNGKLQDFGIDLSGIGGNINYSPLFDMNTFQEIKIWAEEQLKALIDVASRNMEVSENKIIFNAKNYIINNFSTDITLEDVAAHVFLSPVYFSRLFKKKTGENFTDFLLKIRMDKARELLLNPEYKVYEICSMVGYKSAKYFYGLFKNYFGLTPTEYRNNMLRTGEHIYER